MLKFENDYCEAATPEILNKLLETTYVKTAGYGVDEFCESAKEKIRKEIGIPGAQMYFLAGGTQTNQIAINSMLKSYEGVVACDTGHVNVHEAGAIEFSGHKVLTLPNHNGKMCADELKELLVKFYADESFDHMVFPGMVYISHPTELGTLYTKEELKSLHSVCEEYKIPLYLDGARLGYGLMAEGTDVTIKDIAELTDLFYIGGTKVGALYGEALIFTKNNMPKYFHTIVKQHGAMAAKGRVLGIQFDTLFTDGLYYEISKNAIKTATRLKEGLKEKGYEFLIDSPTNQIFVIATKEQLTKFEGKVKYTTWEKINEDKTAIRFVTSWATSMEDIEELIKIL